MTDHSCEQAKEFMAAAWAEELDQASSALLQSHLKGCADCEAEMLALGAMWEKLGDLPVPEPSMALRARWEQTMDSLTAGQYSAASPRAHHPVSRGHWWQNFWPANPAWQMAVAGLCLIAGLGGGVVLENSRSERNEVAQLREEVANTKEMVAVSLLQQQSATDRLRGVDYSARMSSMEPEVITALIQAVNRDSSVNVRLAAIDALSKVANESHVRASMQEALPQQDSPMVQAALIDYLVSAHDRNAVSAIQTLAARPDLNPAVRERATYAVSRLAQ